MKQVHKKSFQPKHLGGRHWKLTDIGAMIKFTQNYYLLPWVTDQLKFFRTFVGWKQFQVITSEFTEYEVEYLSSN